jgi:hypothetical protein
MGNMGFANLAMLLVLLDPSFGGLEQQVRTAGGFRRKTLSTARSHDSGRKNPGMNPLRRSTRNAGTMKQGQ